MTTSLIIQFFTHTFLAALKLLKLILFGPSLIELNFQSGRKHFS